MSKRVIYIGIFLDERSAHLLRGRAVHSEVKCHHLTIAFRPGMDMEGHFANRLGETVEIQGTQIVSDDRIQALRCVLPWNIGSMIASVPHVTMSHVKGVPPKESTDLLLRTTPRRTRSMPLKGRIGFFMQGGEIVTDRERYETVAG